MGTSKRAANEGSSGMRRGGIHHSRELAEVVLYNSGTHTALLRTHSGRPLHNVPQIRPGRNDFEHLSIGETVVVSYDLGFPVIDGIINICGDPQDIIASVPITGTSGFGADDPTQPTQGDHNYAPPMSPNDLGPGDWAKVGALGNHVAVLEGGISSIGSPNALVRSLGLNGILQIFAKNTQTVTDFGNWQVTNDGGATSFILRAGSNQSTQTGYDEEHWTIKLDLGATGDLFNFNISTPDGNTLFRFQVNADGHVQIYGDAGVDISAGASGDKEQRSDILGTRTTNVGADDSKHVKGAQTLIVGQSRTENINTDKNASIGGAETNCVNGDRTITVGGNMTKIVSGGSTEEAKPGNAAYALKILNGDYNIAIGDPTAGASPSAKASFNLKSFLGDISLSANAGTMALKALKSVDISALMANIKAPQIKLSPGDTPGTKVPTPGAAARVQDRISASLNLVIWATVIESVLNGVAMGALTAALPSGPFATWAMVIPGNAQTGLGAIAEGSGTTTIED